jgi:PAS domain S-box-containing protein
MPFSAELLSNEQLLEVLTLTKSAAAIHISERAVIQFANDAMIAFWGKGRTVMGKPLDEALPELKGQPFIELFARVWREGITISGTDAPADLEVDGVLQTFYFDYEYRAIKNAEGKTYCILHTAEDVTARVLSARREQRLSEELTASNEELYATNEELTVSNEELRQSQLELQALYENLSESDSRFRSMVKQAPVGICIIRAGDLFVEEVNDSYLELVGKQRTELERRTIWEAVPEAAEAYAPIMSEVIRSGKAFSATEHQLELIRRGKSENVFVDFVYEPIKGYDGTIKAIMVLAIEVTDKVNARRSIEEMEERVRLAVEAAEIGTFDLDLNSNVMLTSERFNIIFGFDRNVSRREFADAIYPDDRPERARAHDEAYKTGTLFYEARVIHPDASIHWLRVQGKIYYDVDHNPSRILGTVLDITEFKRLQNQKDDFISIASHELKTPITSLKASFQLLERMKDHPPAPEILSKLISQSSRSIGKISSLIEDLLNVSRSNGSEIRLNKTQFNLYNMLSVSCNHIRVANKYKLTVHGDRDLMVTADEHAIDQVVVNFVNNAVKYAPESVEIELNFERTGDTVKVAVKDSGPGISADKIPHLFDRYYQASPAGYQSSGLGLGLYICSQIVKRHGGQIGVESQMGNGSTFWFTLPLV